MAHVLVGLFAVGLILFYRQLFVRIIGLLFPPRR
jgi:hypothetical protein